MSETTKTRPLKPYATLNTPSAHDKSINEQRWVIASNENTAATIFNPYHVDGVSIEGCMLVIATVDDRGRETEYTVTFPTAEECKEFTQELIYYLKRYF